MAFKARDAVTALSAIEAEIALLAQEAVKLFVTLFATVIEPVTNNDPVNVWVSVNKLPKRVEPVIKLTEEVIVWTTIVVAVNVPLTLKLSAEEAVLANVA